MPIIRISVNSVLHEVKCREGESLLELLRERLGLTGTKRGCDSGQCGACTVVMNGRSVRSCRIHAENSDGAEITTIEGLSASGEDLHPIQRAFLETGAVQCGYCTPGMIMEAYALVVAAPHPDRKTIRRAFHSHLCRCTGYLPIEEAILRACDARDLLDPGYNFDIQTSPARVDGTDKVTGKARFTDDIRIPDVCHGALFWSPVASGIVEHLDTRPAASAEGVIRIITARDIPGVNGIGRWRADRPLLVEKEIRFAGDALALVIADTEDHARAAVRAIVARIKPLTPILSMTEAIKENARAIHDGGNTASRIRIEKTPESSRPVDISTDFHSICETQFVEHAVLEPACAVAVYDGEGILHVTAPTQNVFFDRLEIIRILGLMPREFRRVVVHQPHIGGAFGKHEDIFVAPLAALGAFLTGRPCKVKLTRAESFLCSSKRHPMRIEHTSRVDHSGNIYRTDIRIEANTGAYASWAPNILRKAAVHATGPYSIPSLSVEGKSIFTNAAFSGAMRGFGATQSLIAAELHMDRMARASKIDPLEFRLRHALRRGSATATEQRIDDCEGLEQVLKLTAERFGWNGWTDGTVIRDGWSHGVGVAGAFYGIGYGNGIPDKSQVRIEIAADGKVRLFTSAVEYGQGSSTIFSRIVQETLGCPFAAISVETPSTSATPDSGSTVASRQTFVTGSAFFQAAAAIRDRIIRSEAMDVFYLETSPESSGRWKHRSDGTPIEWSELVNVAINAGIQLTESHRFLNETECLNPSTGKGKVYRTYCFSAACAEVRWHPEHRKAEIIRVVTVHDSGRILHPALARSQVTGGVVMAAGYALFEHYRLLDGIPQSLDFDRYRIPRFGDVPIIDVDFYESPCRSGPLGAKGLGEPAMLAAAPALISALQDATGRSFSQLPVLPTLTRDS